jgi:uncharacterized protein
LGEKEVARVRAGLKQVLPGLVVTLALGTLGGLAARALHLPLGLLLGSIFAVGLAAILGVCVAGVGVGFPQGLRNLFVPIIGVAIGGAFTPDVLRQMPGWWISLLALLIYIPVAHGAGYFIYRRGGLPKAEAFFGAVPGGLIESVVLGEEAGADERTLILLQFLRLILTIIAVPVIFLVLTGHSVGSAAGAQMGGDEATLSALDLAVLLLAGGIGYLVGRALRFPAAIMTGPVLASAIVHLMGWSVALPPGWAVGVTQVVLGSALGARFAGIRRAELARALWLATQSVGLALMLAFGFAWAVSGLVDQPIAAGFLAFAPGGLAEMSLIALSLKVGVVYVAIHHVVRIVVSVTVAKIGVRWIR